MKTPQSGNGTFYSASLTSYYDEEEEKIDSKDDDDDGRQRNRLALLAQVSSETLVILRFDRLAEFE